MGNDNLKWRAMRSFIVNHHAIHILFIIGFLGLLCLVITTGIYYQWMHNFALILTWLITAAFVFKGISILMDYSVNMGWTFLMVTIICFAFAYYYILSDVLSDFNLPHEQSDLF